MAVNLTYDNNSPESRVEASETTGSSLTTEGQYNFTNLVFPRNIGQPHVGHWMKININVPNKFISTSTNPYGSPSGGGGVIGVSPDNLPSTPQILNQGSTLDSLPGNQASGLLRGLRRDTKRISSTIILAMPQNNITYNSENEYENVSFTAIAGKGVAALASGVAAPLIGAAAAVGLFKISNSVGQTLSKATTLAGYPLNPRLEILFSGRKQRQFVFELLMSPTSEKEADTIQNIIRVLRFHSSPELVGAGFFFVPPADFDIEFYFNGKRNEKIPRINTCVLERIEVDYSPSAAFSTFSTGHPVQMRLSMGFREIEVLHKARIQQGF